MQQGFFDDKRPEGVANTIDITKYDSVVEVLNKACKEHSSRQHLPTLVTPFHLPT